MTTSPVFAAVVPVVPVANVTDARSFYGNQLGMAEIFAQGDYVGVRRDEVELHLDGTHGGSQIDAPVTVRIHLATADSVDELYRAVEPAGVIDPDEPLDTKPWGMRQFSVLDPWRNRLTFVAVVDQ